MTKLINDTFQDQADESIGEYSIRNWAYQIVNEKEKIYIYVKMFLTRKIFSIFMVTFLPTILMNIINQASNYIPGENKFDMIITINITSMMVLASIYLSVSSSLPITPNIKPVEWWLLFNLSYPFLVIMTNIIVEQKKKKSTINSSIRMVSPIEKNGNEKKINFKYHRLFEFIALFLNPLMYVIFSLFFCLYYIDM